MRKTLIILATLGTIGLATSQAQAGGSYTTCYNTYNGVSCYSSYY